MCKTYYLKKISSNLKISVVYKEGEILKKRGMGEPMKKLFLKPTDNYKQMKAFKA